MPRNLFVSFGDSVTCGVACRVPTDSYAARVFDALKVRSLCTEHKSVAGPGWTTHHLVRALGTLPDEEWQRVGLATVMIGGNDLRRRYYSVLTHPSPTQVITRTVDNCAHEYRCILDQLAQKQLPAVLVLTLYNPLPHSRHAASAITKLNDSIREAAAKHRFQVVDLYELFLGRESSWVAQYRTGQLQDLSTPYCRPLHPNDQGHEAIANLLISKIDQVMA